jgi:hypothetical protein
MPIKGFIESVQLHEIRGWAYDSDWPDQHVEIMATIDGRELGMTVADISRPDLVAANIGKGDHGFTLRLKPPLLLSERDKVKIAAGRDGDIASRILPRLRPWDYDEKPRKSRFTVSPRQSDSSQRPVFILGTTRSGTSSISLGLLRSGRYAGAGEGHFLELLGSLHAAVDQYYDGHSEALMPNVGTMLKRIPEDLFLNKIEQIFIELISDIFPNRYWIDKTPSSRMVELSPTLLGLWPNSRFIFMKRRALENVVSKVRKFNQSFASSCREWTGVMNSWLNVRDVLKNAAIEMDQIDVAIAPLNAANLIAKHIDLPDKYVGAFTSALANDRPEMTTDSFPAIMDFNEMSWSVEEKQEFLRICGPTMESYGYTYDRKYRKNEPLNP